MTSETLPELIHRLVEAKGRPWVEREIGYSPDVIDRYLAAHARAAARRSPAGQPTPPDQVKASTPLRLGDLAAHLRVRPDTLSRALRNDPAAPRPVPGTTPDAWDYAQVFKWWPERRRRGQRGPARRNPDLPETTP
ncbi:hypothetical protein [Streptomyces goshikiensis]|uniref:hypothetical protein n=1 Tax=Streptomyces goshikiensis TaxID=1942 RepID=UPI00364F6EE5